MGYSQELLLLRPHLGPASSPPSCSNGAPQASPSTRPRPGPPELGRKCPALVRMVCGAHNRASVADGVWGLANSPPPHGRSPTPSSAPGAQPELRGRTWPGQSLLCSPEAEPLTVHSTQGPPLLILSCALASVQEMLQAAALFWVPPPGHPLPAGPRTPSYACCWL